MYECHDGLEKPNVWNRADRIRFIGSTVLPLLVAADRLAEVGFG